MESLSILKFWRNVTGADVSSVGDSFRNNSDEETDDEESFFDLVFKSPASTINEENQPSRKEFHFVESPRDVFMSEKNFAIDSDTKLLSSPISLLKSGPMFKVFMLGFRKAPKSEKSESGDELPASPSTRFSRPSKNEQSKRFTVKCKSEVVPVAPVFTRDNSLRSKLVEDSSDETSMEAKSKQSVPKYLKLIKPLYVKVSKRQNEKSKFSKSVTPLSSPMTAPVNLSLRKFSESSRVGSFKIVTKHLGKSRSASAAIGLSPSPISRRDGSLMQQHEDGIQGAILHCKKSYNASWKGGPGPLCVVRQPSPLKCCSYTARGMNDKLTTSA
ncbi:putative membrane-associated kinase regulator 2 [Forsythia ovata]|uniref:Membrane-associated kinase regulator 2 n=1 Tax=Forsythia ovata TaxID=205694 RepID=A0ABD1X2X7_9LAMI